MFCKKGISARKRRVDQETDEKSKKESGEDGEDGPNTEGIGDGCDPRIGIIVP